MRTLITAIILFAAMAAPVSAHLAGGQDILKEGYILDFGFDPAEPVAGELGTFAFNFADAKTGKELAPDSVWVRMTRGDVVEFAGTFHPVNGNVTFQAIVPEPGDYEVTAHYAYRGKEIDAGFHFTAAERPASETIAAAPAGQAPAGEITDRERAVRALGAVVIATAAYLLGMRRGRMQSIPKKTGP